MTHWHSYCDETCISKPNDYMAIGGLFCPKSFAKSFAADIASWRAKNGMSRELKWTGIGESSLARYQDLGAQVVGHIRGGRLFFAAIILERKKLNHRLYNGGCDVVGQSKFLCQMGLHQFLPCMWYGDTMTIFPDQKRGKAYSSGYGELKGALNSSILKKYHDYRVRVTDVCPICSKSSQLAQMNDILLGAVGCHANGRHLQGDGDSPKSRYSNWLARQLGFTSLADQTCCSEKQFQVWRFRLS